MENSTGVVEVTKPIQLLQLTESAYEYYCLNVKGNLNTDFETARKKLTRNVWLSISPDGSPSEISPPLEKRSFFYGNLHIVVMDGCITGIKNIKNPPQHNHVKVKREKYEEFNELLGIKSKKETANERYDNILEDLANRTEQLQMASESISNNGLFKRIASSFSSMFRPKVKVG